MIVSASRRTDIPAFYAPWLLARLRAGYALVRNPFRPTQVRRVDLRPAPGGELDALVLWTRDPGPLLDSVPEWERGGLRTLWLVTMTGYPPELEPGARPVEAVANALDRLTKIVGPARVAWRYDPVLTCPALGLDAAWHGRNFRRLADRLAPAVGRCIVSLYDDYAKSRRRLAAAGLAADLETDPEPLWADLAQAARERGLPLRTCCEDATPWIDPGACIDGPLLDRLWGLGLGTARDASQRSGCGCAPSVDLGAYDTCTRGCLYCYATGSPAAAASRSAGHDPEGEALSRGPGLRPS